MELTLRECKKILDTLPTGYYCGRKVAVRLDEKEATSYYSPIEDSIVVSYPIICKGLEKCVVEIDKEVAVRSMLYHELSHAILTPANVMGHCPNSYRTALNVFEDERIETLLNDYYIDVNFKQQLYNINGDVTAGLNINDPDSVFYAVVRYRYGKKTWTDRVANIIKKYEKLNRNSIYYGNVENYLYDVEKLYDDIAKSVAGKKKTKKLEEKDMKLAEKDLSDLMPNIDKHGKPSPMSGDKKEKGAENGSEKGEEKQGVTTDESEDEHGKERAHGREKASILKDAMKEIQNPLQNLTTEQYNQLTKMEKTISMLIANFHKKNSKGNGYNAYSGVFNPRSVVRDDYKFFDRKAQLNGNNQYGTCHLNLVIDRSGSFWSNEDIVNSILRVLTRIEKKNPDFSLDVSFINTRMETCQSIKDRVIHCTGGNKIPEDFAERMRKLQKINSYNYNIVLFDGDALSDVYGSIEELSKLFRQIDQSQTCLITDNDNEMYMRDSNKFTKAKVIITTEYTDELIKNIERAFGMMFS